VIDAKFPCDTSKPAAPLVRQQCTSKVISSSKMNTMKEDAFYTKIRERKINSSEAMTPLDARNRLSENECKDCDCKYEDAI
jgi:hypothetical protein